MAYILTLDVGTTSVKCGVFDEKLRQIKVASAEYALQTPSARIVEVTSDTYLQKIRKCLIDMRQAGVDTRQICYVVATTQGETLIPLDEMDMPLCDAVVWLDSRAQKEAEILSAQFPDEVFYRVTGLPGLDGYAPIAKMMQLAERFAAEGKRLKKFLLLEDYLIFKLTGRMVTEKTLLSSTGFFDIRHDRLWDEILQAAGVRREWIPEILESGELVGSILPEMAEYLQISPAAQIVTGAMDQVCGAIGCGNLEEGCLHETTGTAMVIGASTRTPDFEDPRRLTVYRHAIPGMYLLIPICRTAAIIQKWFREQFCDQEAEAAKAQGISVYDRMAELAENAKADPDGPLLLPYFNGCLAPASIDNARGCFWGIGLDTTKADMIRAIPEGISFMLRENLEMLQTMGIEKDTIFFLGGPSQNPFWCQMKADITGKRVCAAPGLESTSFGAACLAAQAAGFYPTAAEAAASYGDYQVFLPDEEKAEIYNKKYSKYQKLVACASDFYNTQ